MWKERDEFRWDTRWFSSVPLWICFFYLVIGPAPLHSMAHHQHQSTHNRPIEIYVWISILGIELFRLIIVEFLIQATWSSECLLVRERLKLYGMYTNQERSSYKRNWQCFVVCKEWVTFDLVHLKDHIIPIDTSRT
jgi:hypothetical protein